jgi:two-component system, NtrC family, nitrogen regulation response regulator NtrX
MTRILVVEDDGKIRAHLAFQLGEEGHGVEAVATAEEALPRIAREPPELLLLDVRLPGMSGVELVRRLAAEARLPPTVIVSGEASITETVEALRLGVHDFIEKPFTRERLLQSVRNALEAVRLRREVAALAAEAAGTTELLGGSRALAEVRELIAKAAPTDARVLILGESGTGKELVADALHRGSPRRDRPFIKVNCAAIPDHLIEAELFGYARGAFTDARTAKPGLFEEAHGGTLFLDEIGDMALPLQSRLLRVLEDGLVRRLGETRERQVEVRVIAATHQDLAEAVAEGRFRQDLYFRLSNLPIRVPPLRERPDDVRPLFAHFVDYFRLRHRTGPRRIDPGVYPLLERHRWPGNVRELKALAERLVVFGGDPITAERLPPSLRGEAPSETAGDDGAGDEPVLPLRDFRARAERRYVEGVLARTGWNFTAAARLLGLERTYLHQKAAQLGIRRPRPDGDDG